MTIAKKIRYGVLISIGLFFCLVVFSLIIDEYEESKFRVIKIPESLNFEKPIDFLRNGQIDSLKNIEVNEPMIVVIGSGYNGYNFYIWHKPTEKGEIYIKAFELTQNIRLSELHLMEGTKNNISELSKNYQLYESRAIIGEGTFENYYPARFELWFKSENSGIEKKLTERNYVIDGWDR